MMRYIVLGLLRDGHPRHGYAIIKEYRDATGSAPSVANVYRELHSLLALGWVRQGTNPPDEDARRVPYLITAAGAGALHEWLAAPGVPSVPSSSDSFSLRAFVVAHIGDDLPRRVLACWREEVSHQHQMLRREHDSLLRQRKRTLGQGGAFPITLERRLKHISTDLEFVTRLEVIPKGRESRGEAGAVDERRPEHSTPLGNETWRVGSG